MLFLLSDYYTHMTSQVPAEILEQILNKVSSKKDLENCLLVCRSWNHVADRCRFNNGGIQVSLNGTNSMHFLQNLEMSTNFGPEIKVLMFNDDDATTFQTTVNRCINLTGLRCAPKFLLNQPKHRIIKYSKA